MEETKEPKQETKELTSTDQADCLLHMILDLKSGKETDLYQMQTMVLSMHKTIMDLSHEVETLKEKLESSKIKDISIPRFMFEQRAH